LLVRHADVRARAVAWSGCRSSRERPEVASIRQGMTGRWRREAGKHGHDGSESGDILNRPHSKVFKQDVPSLRNSNSSGVFFFYTDTWQYVGKGWVSWKLNCPIQLDLFNSC
jgi:hypothetical protein